MEKQKNQVGWCTLRIPGGVYMKCRVIADGTDNVRVVGRRTGMEVLSWSQDFTVLRVNEWILMQNRTGSKKILHVMKRTRENQDKVAAGFKLRWTHKKEGTLVRAMPRSMQSDMEPGSTHQVEQRLLDWCQVELNANEHLSEFMKITTELAIEKSNRYR
jgi:hypothetical protein